MAYDNIFYLLGTLGSEKPLSNNDADLSMTIEDIVRENRLPNGTLKRYRTANPLKHWHFTYSSLPGKSTYVFDGGLSRDDLWALYLADAEMSFLESNDQGARTAYTVRFAANSWQQQLLQRVGDFWLWQVSFELVQTVAV